MESLTVINLFGSPGTGLVTRWWKYINTPRQLCGEYNNVNVKQSK